MTTLTKHNNLDIPTIGTKNWGARCNENTTLMEHGSTVRAVAGLTVSINEVGYLDSNNQWGKARANATVPEGRWLGFFTTDINQNAEGHARHNGYQKNEAWSFIPGPVYLSDSIAGAVTQAEPDSKIIVGFAIGTNEVLIKPWSVSPELDLITSNPGEGHISILAWNKDSIPAGGWIPITHSGPMLYAYSYNTGAADLDKVRFKAYLAAGTYTFKMTYGKANNRGITEVLIDDVSIGTWDGYNSTQTWNHIATVTDLNVTESSIKNIDLAINGQNASSSGYFQLITLIEFYRTG